MDQRTIDQSVDWRQLEESKPGNLPSTASALNEYITGTNNDNIDMIEAVKYRPLITHATITPTSAIIPPPIDDDIHYYTDATNRLKN